ncbi:hypothetical protein ACFZAR_43525 [Streptomyces sp. NPDC008222]|uniref:hypothetical protein n=1 Tax=Streptomyces sp. NPDC008222 TaxID=3364820 RepID=UPI0036F0436C
MADAGAIGVECARVLRGSGEDVTADARARRRVPWASSPRRRNAGLPGVAAQAISAVDIALRDAKARLLGLPLARLLGAARDDVPVCGSGGFTTDDDRRQDRRLRGWVEEEGIPRVKIKIGESWGRCEARDRRRVTRAGASIGGAAESYVHANGGYGPKQAPSGTPLQNRLTAPHRVRPPGRYLRDGRSFRSGTRGTRPYGVRPPGQSTGTDGTGDTAARCPPCGR